MEAQCFQIRDHAGLSEVVRYNATSCNEMKLTFKIPFTLLKSTVNEEFCFEIAIINLQFNIWERKPVKVLFKMSGYRTDEWFYVNEKTLKPLCFNNKTDSKT